MIKEINISVYVLIQCGIFNNNYQLKTNCCSSIPNNISWTDQLVQVIDVRVSGEFVGLSLVRPSKRHDHNFRQDSVCQIDTLFSFYQCDQHLTFTELGSGLQMQPQFALILNHP